jgi:hypothetical protein
MCFVLVEESVDFVTVGVAGMCWSSFLPFIRYALTRVRKSIDLQCHDISVKKEVTLYLEERFVRSQIVISGSYSGLQGLRNATFPFFFLLCHFCRKQECCAANLLTVQLPSGSQRAFCFAVSITLNNALETLNCCFHVTGPMMISSPALLCCLSCFLFALSHKSS